MSAIKKLVIYSSAAALAKSAANYPCLVNYDPFDRQGTFDDGVGHSAAISFAVVTSDADLAKLPAGPFDVVELIGFQVPTSLVGA